MEIQDIYKLTHQAAMGCKHAVNDPAKIREELIRELNEMGRGPSEPLIDPISSDGEIIRIHLRPFTLTKGDIDNLTEAFCRTASEFFGNTEILESYWDCEVQTNLFPLHLMEDYIKNMKYSNFPSVHHSDAYRQAFKSAYRVVWRKFFRSEKIGS